MDHYCKEGQEVNIYVILKGNKLIRAAIKPEILVNKMVKPFS